MTHLESFLAGKSFLELTRDQIESHSQQSINTEEYEYKFFEKGIISITPREINSDKCLVLSCAVHGNETAPIEIVEELLSSIRDGKIKLSLPTLFIFGNPRAINMKTRFLDFNLNRLFNSHYRNIDECYETKRAQILEESMSEFFEFYPQLEKLHYDLHTAIKPSVHEKFAIVPYCDEKETPNMHLAFLQDLGLDAIVFSSNKANTFSDHSSSNFGAHSMTVELGKVYPFGQNPVENFKQAKQTLTELLSGQYTFKEQALNKVKCYEIVENIIRNNDSFEFHFSTEIKNFEEFKLNESLWTQDAQTKTAQQEGLCILFPNDKVKFGQRAGLLIKERK